MSDRMSFTLVFSWFRSELIVVVPWDMLSGPRDFFKSSNYLLSCPSSRFICVSSLPSILCSNSLSLVFCSFAKFIRCLEACSSCSGFCCMESPLFEDLMDCLFGRLPLLPPIWVTSVLDKEERGMMLTFLERLTIFFYWSIMTWMLELLSSLRLGEKPGLSSSLIVGKLSLAFLFSASLLWSPWD